MKKALVLFSGGLDSLLTIKILQHQNIDVTAIYFVSCFFNKENKIKYFADKYNFKIIIEDFSIEHAKIVKKPEFGYGQNFNPCVDCHLLMLTYCSKYIENGQYDFIATGEVLEQRPFSQNSKTFPMMEERTELKGYILRPLSALQLPLTIPEKFEWIDRNKLYGIVGKRREIQLKLAQEFNLTDFESPAGGCLLTDENYSKKLRIIKKDRLFEQSILFEIIKHGRFEKFANGVYIISGRNKEDNDNLLKLKEHFNIFITEDDISAPSVGIFGYAEGVLERAKEIAHHYSKLKGKGNINLIVNHIKTQYHENVL